MGKGSTAGTPREAGRHPAEWTTKMPDNIRRKRRKEKGERMATGTMDDGAPDDIRRKRRSRCWRKEEADAGLNPAEKKKEIRRKKQKNAPTEVARTGQ